MRAYSKILFLMNSRKIILLIITLLALLVAGCISEPLPETGKEEGKIVTISASIPAETRVTYDDDTRKLSWQEGDKLLLAGYDGATYKGSRIFNWDSGNTFTGQEVTGATTYKAYYPGEKVTLDANGNVIPGSATSWNQAQNGENSTAHLRNHLLLFDEEANLLTETFNLTSKNSIIKFKLKNVPAGVGTLNSLSWTVETATGVFKAMTLSVTGVTFSSALDTITAFLAFDPAVMKIAANGNFKITLFGNKSYQWSIDVAGGKNYTVGNRYTATVNGGWSEMITPLVYVAESNVNPAGNGFVTDLTACNVSGYFNWNAAKAINISGYHLPSIDEWRSIIPQNTNYVYFTSTSPYNNIAENVIVQGVSINMHSDYNNTGNNLTYALRYKGTDYVSAWKYEYISDGNNTHMKITSRSVAPSVTIGNISDNNGAFWNTGQENDVVRYFPASGYKSSSGSLFYVGTHGRFWSSTENNSDNTVAWNMQFHETFAATNSDNNSKDAGQTVRLFAGNAPAPTPLIYVAESNVNSAGTGFVTNLTACDLGNYINWNVAQTINISGYHLPSVDEWRGIIPQNSNYVYFTSNPSYGNISESVIVQGESINMTSDYKNTGSSSNPAPSYALRYKGTKWVSAWKYEFISDGNNSHMKITSRRVAPSVTIGNISDNNGAFWNTGQENDVVRYFPASGYKSSTGKTYNVGTYGYYWSSTENNSDNTVAWNMQFYRIFANTNYTRSKSNGLMVRLFSPGN